MKKIRIYYIVVTVACLIAAIAAHAKAVYAAPDKEGAGHESYHSVFTYDIFHILYMAGNIGNPVFKGFIIQAMLQE